MRRHRANYNFLVLLANTAQIGDAAEIDQRVRPRQAQFHRRQQSVPAGDEARLSVARDQAARLVEALRAAIPERLHRRDFDRRR